ncbi:MAG: ABC transporter permease [Candidatus Hodarchaeales archaeon]
MIDTLNFNYLDTATIQAGSSDIQISKTISMDLSFEPFFDQNYIESKLQNEEEIDYLFPRIMQFVDVEPLGKSEEKSRIIFYGIDSELEQNSGRLGDLKICDPETLEDTDELYSGPIPAGYAIILKNTAKILNVSVGDYLTLTYTRHTVNLTVEAICTQDLRFSVVETNLIIAELEQAQIFLEEEGKINNLYATLRYREYIYDTKDIAGTTEDLLEIGARLQEQLGFDYIIELPKLAELETVESETMMMEVMMSFATFLAVMISAILINSVLTTSVEERIREFGVMRVLGGKNRENVAMVIIQRLFIGLIGTGVGVLISVFFVPAFLLWI